jgi:hypothetical protein
VLSVTSTQKEIFEKYVGEIKFNNDETTTSKDGPDEFEEDMKVKGIKI